MTDKILEDGEQHGLQLSFVWNRSIEVLHDKFTRHKSDVTILDRIEHINRLRLRPHLIVEVCHPDVLKQYGSFLLKQADLLVNNVLRLLGIV